MSEKEKAAKSEIQILRDAFEGLKGRQPKSDQELKEWLATDEVSDMRPKAHIPLDPRHVPFSAMCGRVRVMPLIDQKMSTILEAT